MASTLPDPLDELDRLLLGIKADEVMLLAEVEGLIAASLVAPGPLPEETWLPVIWGGGAAPLDEATLARLRALVMARRTEVVGQLLQGDLAYDPVYDLDTDDVPLWQIWIDGFAAGVALAGEAWIGALEDADEDLGAAMMGLNVLIAAADQPPPKRRRRRTEIDEMVEQAPDLIPYLVETLYRRQRGLPRVVLDPSAGLPLFGG